MEKISGIYSWQCQVNGKRYIGQSKDIHKRKEDHLKSLQSKSHINSKLQNDWNIFGEKFFTFEILNICSEDMLNHLEDFYIKKYNSIDDGYNIASGSLRCYSNENIKDSIFKQLDDETERFIITNVNPILKDSKEDKLDVFKFKLILELISNSVLDYKFIFDILERINIEIFAEIPITSQYFDHEIYGKLCCDKYIDTINYELALEMIENDPKIKLFFYKKLQLKSSITKKINEQNKIVINKKNKIKKTISLLTDQINNLSLNTMYQLKTLSINELFNLHDQFMILDREIKKLNNEYESLKLI